MNPPARLLLLVLACTATAALGFEDPVWRFTERKPAAGWETEAFDAGSWKTGNGGFGEPSTPGARVGTTWKSKQIWLRRTVRLPENTQRPALYLFHDEDAQVFLNGQKVADLKGFLTEYKVIPLEGEALKAVREGENLLAVHCRQTIGGQAIDVHLIDTNELPKLPKPRLQLPLHRSPLITTWGEKVTPENAWQEYPRPQLVRESWRNLNGLWDFAVTPIEQKAAPENWGGKILVPFAIESKLSGVTRALGPEKALWYRRSLKVEKEEGRRYLLNFEAVDYRSSLWVNGTEIGTHVGGNLPFTHDITAALKAGENELRLRVTDATDSKGAYQLHGKQRLSPRGIWYTPVSGIWQTVWLEEVPEAAHISGLKITTRVDGTVTVALMGLDGTAHTALLTASLAGAEVAKASGEGGTLAFQVPDPKLWSPDSPTLYDLSLTCGLDTVTTRFGIREIGREKDEEGHWRFTLNGKPVFPLGTLDQGWWPDGLLTPPSDAAMRSDIEFLKAAGFNTVRKHIKVEPRRYYAHCDEIGLLVWQDQVSSLSDNPRWTRLQPAPETRTWPEAAHAQFMREHREMIDLLHNHPSIVQWVPFNEAWGQHQTVEVGKWAVAYDPTRHINIASGGNFHPAGHIVDHHQYPHPGFPFDLARGGRFDGYLRIVGEFGGHGFPVEGHLWNPGTRNWGYGGLPKDKEEWIGRYRESMRLLAGLRGMGIAAGIYTQTTDVEGEINGLLTYDRKVPKVPAETLRQIHVEAGFAE